MQELLKPKDGWVVKRLGEIAFITKLAGFEYTNYFNSYRDGGEIIVIHGTNITKNELDLSDIKTIPRSTSNKLPRSKLSKGDLAFAYVGTIGPVYLVDENDRFHLGPNTCKISAEKLISHDFLYVYFTSKFIEKEIVEHTSTGAQPSLSMTKIRNFKICFPEKIEDQTRIATILSDMDAEIAALEAKLSKYRQIKQGMMQELLTGRIRLI
jgi:type I restriction enzyme S subunit